MNSRPDILLAYLGDDFTGSTDVMDALSRAGVRTALFLQPPTPGQLARFPGLQAFGVAGGSRTLSPDEMERSLPPAFAALKASGAPIVHYKICSTFDSSPTVGSIGKAIEIGRRIFGEAPTPLVVGAPILGRYVVFGNLFARSGLDSEPSRLDRHPTMSRHPVTPMDEADLRVHLARQTNLPIELIDVLQLELLQRDAGRPGRPGSFAHEPPPDEPPGARERSTPPVLLFDTINADHLREVGRAIDDLASRHRPLFCAGSSGIEYALMSHRGHGVSTDAVRKAAPAGQLIAVSGSCSPVTARQMARAAGAGFVLIAVDPGRFVEEGNDGPELRRTIAVAREALGGGRSILLHTSRGPEDARISRFGAAMSARPPGVGSAEFIGTLLGRVLEAVLRDSGCRRLVACGGDTSTCIARTLGIEALEYLAPMAPGSPLCRAHAPGRDVDGCEVVFKGGQVGRDDFFLDVLAGGPPPNHQTEEGR